MGAVSLTRLYSRTTKEALEYLDELIGKLASRDRFSLPEFIGAGPAQMEVVHYDHAAKDEHAVWSQQAHDGHRLTFSEEVASVEKGLILGEAFERRSKSLKHLVSTVASESRDSLRRYQRLPEAVCVPVYVRFAEVAALIGNAS